MVEPLIIQEELRTGRSLDRFPEPLKDKRVVSAMYFGELIRTVTLLSRLQTAVGVVKDHRLRDSLGLSPVPSSPAM